MAQALCRLVARLTGFALLLEDTGGDVWLIPQPGRGPAGPRWLPRLLRLGGLLQRGETPRRADELTTPGRLRLASRGTLRAEFAAGAEARFRALALREARDFADLSSLAFRPA